MRLPPPWVRLTTPPPWCLTTLGSSTGSRARCTIQVASAWTGTHIWRRPGCRDDLHSWKSKFPISRMWTASTDGHGLFSHPSSPSSTSFTGCIMPIKWEQTLIKKLSLTVCNKEWSTQHEFTRTRLQTITFVWTRRTWTEDLLSHLPKNISHLLGEVKVSNATFTHLPAKRTDTHTQTTF